ncbi:unnamed protein product [Soboliphyme baturini]|uniref:DNA replication licensing factor MCM7 n=1 Tax=Soboliphyme baturini TaxID=241478 RepID=A0A183IQW8_9BILA|nr:unnamed protein product [Soboliphyme baturini]
MARRLNYSEDKEKVKDFLTTFYVDEPGTKQKVFPYASQISAIANRDQVVLYIELDHLLDFDPELVDKIVSNTRRYVSLFKEVIDGLITTVLDGKKPPVKDAFDAIIYQRLIADEQAQRNRTEENVDAKGAYPPELLRRYEVYFKAPHTLKALSVRQVKSEHIGKLTVIKGVLTRATGVKPMASVISYTCDTCASEIYQPIDGDTFKLATECPSRQCSDNRAGGRLHMQVRGSKFLKFQELVIQEQNDQMPVGGVPRSLIVYVTGENTRLTSPGDHVQITGVFLPQVKTGFRQIMAGLVSDSFFEAHHVMSLSKSDDEFDESEKLTEEELSIIAEEDFYEKLAFSVAPEIYGHIDVKKALLLMLVGGVERNPRGMKIRGSINICLMGDPGVAKSQLLSFVCRLARRSQYTTGRGSSGVGLTAAVTRDPITNEFTLEGGALVLADQGICCIDEFDKMIESDRTSIHEVMEQQTISIAKAGIMTTLNARTSILAAANPVYGRYNPNKSLEQNIQLPAALLSRFDLLWLIRDRPNMENDLKLAQHIVYVHAHSKEPPSKFKPMNMLLVRKYIALCKRTQPVLPEHLTDYIVNTYVELRKDARNNKDTTFTSPRTLLAILRLSTALARLRLSSEVEEPDVVEACRLMEMSKDSLRAEKDQRSRAQKPIDQMFSYLREMLPLTNDEGEDEDQRLEIAMQDAVKKCLSKGLELQVLEDCLNTYEDQGVLMINKDRTKIIFTIGSF